MVHGTWANGTGSFTSTTAAANYNLTWGPPPPVETNPVLMGDGPAECSSCTELSVRPLNIYDVNGYYRELGVSPRATRKELRLAYQEAVGHAQDAKNAARLTYILQQLLNPQVRYDYDCTPLGELFLDDYVREMLNRRLKAQMAERMARLAEVGVDLESVDEEALQRDVAAEMGFDVEDDDTPSETVDSGPNKDKDGPSPAKFEYSYYLWSTRPRQDLHMLGRLAEWQRYLVSAFAREGVNIRFAVGFHGRPHRWVQALIGYRTVFFLNAAETPTEELATDVALRVRSDRDREARRALAG